MNDLIVQKKLFDVFTRQAVFIEQVKLNEVLLFNDVLADIEKDFKKNLEKISYQNLGEMKKTQVQQFIKILRGSQTAIYSKYQRQLLARLQKFTEATVNQTLIIGGSYLAALEDESSELNQTEEDDDDNFIIIPIGLQRSRNLIQAEYDSNNRSALTGLFVLLAGGGMLPKAWSTVKNAPMPTGGALLLNYLNTALASQMMRVSQSVLGAWVNKQTKEELLSQVVGSKSTGEGNPNIIGGTKSSEIAKSRNTMKAVLTTAIQHTTQIAIGSVNSLIWEGYRWLSVMDGVTSNICRFLNNKKFVYGNGPLPPAHPHCRSHTAPYTGSSDTFTPPSMVAWLRGQNRGFIVGSFKPDVANKVLNGDDAFNEDSVANSVTPITVDQFTNKTDNLF